MFTVHVDNDRFEVTPTADGFSVNGSPFLWDLEKITDGYFHIIHERKSYRAEVVKADIASRSFDIKINGRVYSVKVKNQVDLLWEKVGMNNSAVGKINLIKAPMPGLIIDLKVKAGDRVKKGDPLLILEAMKMENILRATGEGVVKNVKITKGDSVEKNQVLIEF